MTDAGEAPRPRRQMGWYNGWSPDERRAAAAVQRDAVASGELVPSAACSICSALSCPTNRVWFHDEDYADPLAAYPICRRCHTILHERFEDLQPWLALVAAHATGQAWYERLSMDPAAQRRPFAVTYPEGLPVLR